MDNSIFIQRSRLGRATFELNGENVVVTSSGVNGPTVVKVPLRDLSADYDLHAQQFAGLIVVPLIVGAVCYGAIRLLFAQEVIPHALASAPGLLLAMAVVGIFQGLRRVEYFVFYNRRKEPALTIVRERYQAADCDDFVCELLDRIERPHPSAATVATEKRRLNPRISTVTLPRSPHDSFFGSGENRWRVAIVAGAIAAGLPLLVRPDGGFDLDFPIVFAASIAGLVCGGLSFVAKERMKYWALIGVILSLIPLVCYG